VDDASVLSEARIRHGVRAVTKLWRAFDKTVSRKPLAFAVDAVYGISIDSWLEFIAKRDLREKSAIDARQCTGSRPSTRDGTPRPFFFQAQKQHRNACTYTRGGVRRASGFVLTSKPEVIGTNCQFLICRPTWNYRLGAGIVGAVACYATQAVAAEERGSHGRDSYATRRS